jgi:tetratricopeptide (TPR) repeat protein
MFTANPTRKQLSAVICLMLALVTAALYWPMLRHPFINVDDEQYITSNPHVQAGFTWPGIVWAFENTEAANWHPLTWISHMLDCQLFGLNPDGHHLTNLLFHVANTLLLFLLLRQLTGALWRSALVAALFAWHPLRVESVAWASERKDVLSAFFWMLALIAYTKYAQKRSRVEGRVSRADTTSQALNSRPSTLDYLLALLFFACGLMSKPMVVTLPFVLLLLDFWPLERFSRFTFHVSRSEKPSIPINREQAESATRLICEKLPFFALALAGSIVTYLVQKSGGAVWSAAILPFHARAANALWAYERYISKTFWPADLAIIYPYPRHWPVMAVLGAALLLAIWSGLFLWRARQNPYLPVGWFWFLGTFIPAIGLVQVGAQSMADRYTYLPSIGLFILIVWGLNDFLNFRPQWRKMATLTGSMALAGCLVCTRIQLNNWQSSVKLLRHAIEVTTDNFVACNFLGRALDDLGQRDEKDEALLLYAESVRIESHYPQAQYNLGMALLNRGWAEKACEPLAAAVRFAPDNAGAHYYFGMALMDGGRLDDAIAQFNEALQLNPTFAEAQNKLAMIFIKQGKTAEAIRHFAETVRLLPNDAEAHFNLGLVLLDNHRPAEAAVQFSEELRLTPDATKAHYRLAQALQQQNKLASAVEHYSEALRLTPDFSEAKAALDQILSANPNLNTGP